MGQPTRLYFQDSKRCGSGVGTREEDDGGAVKKKKKKKKNLDRDQENLHVEGNMSEKWPKADVSGRQCLVSNHTIGGQKVAHRGA